MLSLLLLLLLPRRTQTNVSVSLSLCLEHVQLLLSNSQDVTNSSIQYYKMLLRVIFDALVVWLAQMGLVTAFADLDTARWSNSTALLDDA